MFHNCDLFRVPTVYIMMKRSSVAESMARGSESNSVLPVVPENLTGCKTAIDEVNYTDIYCIGTPGVKRLKNSQISSDVVSCGHFDDSFKLCETKNPSAVTPASSQSSDASTGTASTAVSTTPMTCQKEIASLLRREANYCCSESKSVTKRLDYISWDDYFMAVASLSAYRSKDPYHPTGACIVDSSNRIIGTGYNGFPAGCSDDILPWIRPSNSSETPTEVTPWLHTPTPYMVHAEVNAILNKCSHDCHGARIYTRHFPCNECAKVIIQSRISEVVYVQGDHSAGCSTNDMDDSAIRASRIMLTMAGIRMRQYTPNCHRLDLNFYSALDDTERQNAFTAQNKIGVDICETIKAEVALNDSTSLIWKEAKYDVVSVGSSKRNDYLSWDDYFMSMAFLTAQRSKDPNTQVGACIVDTNKRIVGLGYNGFPSGCSDDSLPWAREASSELHKKYLYVCHAEVNAVLNKGSADVREGTLYVALFPCNDCSKVIIQAGISEVVYMSDRYHNTDSCRASRILLQMAGVRLRNYIPSVESIAIELNQVR